jgi:phosphoribosylformylglycinamidine synthase PurS subunit
LTAERAKTIQKTWGQQATGRTIRPGASTNAPPFNSVKHLSRSLLRRNIRIMIKATVYVTIKQSVLDPQGVAVQGALHSMGFNEVESVRIGKVMELNLDTTDRAEAEKRLKVMCEKLLANTVVEDYRYELEG